MGANKRVPELRFRGFSGEWEEKKLEEIVDLCSGRDYKHLLDGNIPVYGTGGYMLSVNEALSYDKNAIGIGRKGTINKPYVLKAPFWTVDTLFYAIPKKQNYLSFVYNIFQKINWKQKDESTGVPSLSKVSINSIEIFSSKFDEQTKIGNYFQNLDKLIEQKEKKYQKLGQLKKAMLEKMFPKEGATTPEIRFKGFSGEWEEKGLDSISEQISYGLTVRPKYIEVGIPLISARELKNGNINYNLAPKISIKSYNELSEKAKARKGDIFLTKTGTVGLSAYVRENFPIAITQNIAVIRVVNKQYNHQFILQTFKTQNFYKKSISQVNQSTIMDLQLQDIRKLLISFPNKQEQTKIANSLQKLDNLIDLQNQELQKLKNIKKASLAKMFV